jgi:hypothetical protein
MDPLMQWIKHSCKGAQSEFSDHRQTDLGYVDDLLIMALTRAGIADAAKIINEYAIWGGLVVNVSKSAVTARITNSDGNVLRDIRNVIGRITMGADNTAAIPILQPHEPYKYLGVWISLDLKWKTEFEALLAKVKMDCATVVRCGARRPQKLKL